MKYILYLFASILLLTSCRKVTYTPFLKTNLSFTAASEPQKYWSTHADSSTLQTPLVSEPVTPDFLDKPLLLSHKELNFPSFQKRSDVLVSKQVDKSIRKLQKKENNQKDSRKLEPLAMVSTFIGVVSLPLALLFNSSRFFEVTFVVAITIGIVSLVRLILNKNKFKGKGWAIVGIAYPLFYLILVILFLATLRSIGPFSFNP